MKSDWARKLSSRKLWIAIAGFVSGLIMVFGCTETMASSISGVILQGAAVLGYLIAEGLADSSHTSDVIEVVETEIPPKE